eukprot:TRINITY_DN80590_c0_g1_i1.p1 TRINITY_DN80590_c0_g1~~TRINITY_DN80590_c0_g1_i1.p1  ORF type:complete len:504 (+),score=166.23 TRINITY_DN80590_c0_g1_i1:126-1637(+)
MAEALPGLQGFGLGALGLSVPGLSATGPGIGAAGLPAGFGFDAAALGALPSAIPGAVANNGTSPATAAALGLLEAPVPLPPLAVPLQDTGLRIDAKEWADTFWMMNDNGMRDRGVHAALTVATLKRKGDDIAQQIEALRLAEGALLKAAQDEALKAQAEARPPREAKQARTWGLALANAVAESVKEANDLLAAEEPPFAGTLEAQAVERHVLESMEAHQAQQQEEEERAAAEAQTALMLQAEAVAQAEAMANEQAKALEEAQLQAEAVAQVQAQLQAAAATELEQQNEMEASMAERTALRAQGLNSKKLPLRPGVPACAFFMRKGECKYGKTCKWDHPEVSVNSKGLPMRPGEPPCAFYIRTGVCKFSGTCKFDHPENLSTAAANLGPEAIGQGLLAGFGAPGPLGDLGGLDAAAAEAASVKEQMLKLEAEQAEQEKVSKQLDQQQQQLTALLLQQGLELGSVLPGLPGLPGAPGVPPPPPGLPPGVPAAPLPIPAFPPPLPA